MSLLERPYADSDLPQIQQTLAEWIRIAGICGYCHIGDLAHRIYAGTTAHVPLGAQVRLWHAGEQLVAIAICFRFEAAFDAFVDPHYRGSAGERMILAAASAHTEQLILRHAPANLAVISDVFGCDTNRQEQLRQLGFRAYRQWDNLAERRLDGGLPEWRVPAGFSLRTATMSDAEQLAAVRNAAFGGTWSGAAYQERVMLKPGYQPEREFIVTAPDGRIAAFSIIWLDQRNQTGLFEPVGTHPAFQRRGLARALMAAALRAMQHAGMTSALIAYNAENQAAHQLYTKLGFQQKDSTLGYERPLKP
ncbi:MAG: GNAT family N-acetyltransferase [Oscillochloris sp.]|nr:GNAT family N-acetyltransferase [Oscillochloris sp.]